MPRSQLDVLVDHGCCGGAGRRVRRQCGCLCHDFAVRDYSKRAPTRTHFDRTMLCWHVSRNSGRFVGIVQECERGGFAACGDGVGMLAIVEDPFDAMMILQVWTLQKGSVS